MKELSLNEAVKLLTHDALQLKRVCGWRKAIVEYYSDYIDVEYRTSNTVRRIPENCADEWRMFASGDELIFVLTYYFQSDEDEKK